jgi:hypothetical protein
VGPSTPTSLKKQRITLEPLQEEVPKSLGLNTTPLSFAEQISVAVTAPLVSPKDHAQPIEVAPIEVCEYLELPTIPPSPIRLVGHPRKTREEKGKGKVGDDMSPILPMERFVGSHLLGIIANRTKDKVTRNFLEEVIEGKQPEIVTGTHSDEMPETWKINFLTSIVKTKVLAQRSQPSPPNSLEAKSHDKMIVVEEQEPLMTIPPSNVPSFQTSIDVMLLSNSDKETERYLE